MSKLLFDQLINELKKIKTPQQINDDLLDEMMNASIAMAIELTQNTHQCSFEEAIDIARLGVLKHFDQIIFDARLQQFQDGIGM